jgi:addiction module HigA family antidote
MSSYLDRNPSHPGEVIEALVLEPLGLNLSRAATVLGVRRATLSDLVNGKSALTAEMAFRIEKAFGTDADMLMTLQTRHDLARIQKRARTIKVKRFYRKAA